MLPIPMPARATEPGEFLRPKDEDIECGALNTLELKTYTTHHHLGLLERRLGGK